MDDVIPKAWHPVARTHPETGETSLYVQQGFVQRFEPGALSADEEREILRGMKMIEGKPELTCRFKWEEGTIA